MRRLAPALLLAVLALAPAAVAATTPAPTAPVYDGAGNLVQTPFAPPGVEHTLTEDSATNVFLADKKVADWLDRYPTKDRVTDATFNKDDGAWTVHVWWGAAGEIARGRVDDDTNEVLEAWTGPQVAWSMARGYEGAFGGKELNSPWIWLLLSAAFFVGLADLRRWRSVRNLDLLVLLSFGLSLWAFNEGDVFTSAPLAYPPMLYLIGRMLWIGFRGRAVGAGRPVWPIWVLAAATIFLVGFRIGLNTETSNVIDVGYAGVVGAQRISNGDAPYGHMPIEDNLPKCGVSNADGAVRERVQTNGRCETAIETGDTYGPVNYYAYLPGYWLFGWPGRWDDLPAAHFTAIAWDLILLFGLFLIGRRFGGWRLAVTLAFAWVAYPFTAYTLNANSNDAIMPAFLVWGFWLCSSPVGRGVFSALAGWAKMASLIVVPLWATYPDGPRRIRPLLWFAGAFAATTLLSFWLLLLEGDPLHAGRLFWDRTFVSQFDRHSPFSLWDWGQYHARGIPDLAWLRKVLTAIVALGAVALAFVPRRKSPLQLAALTAALLLAFEVVLIHWFYLYIPWFFPFVVFAVLAPAAVGLRSGAGEPEPERVALPEPRHVAAGVGAVLLLAGAWTLLHFGVWNRIVITDVPVYEDYGEAIAAGGIPYRDVDIAYPPGSLPAFVIPTIGDGTRGYERVFEGLMFLCALATLGAMFVALRALGRRGPPMVAALAFFAVSPLLLGSVVRSRFDLLPVAIAVASLAALLLGRERLGCAGLALGAVVKVFPAVLLPLAVAYAWKRHGRREGLICGALAVGTALIVLLPFVALGPDGMWHTLSVHARRGLQVESLGSGLLLAAHHVGGLGVDVGSSAGSQNIVGSGADTLAALLLVAQLAVVVAIWAAFARGPADKERLVRYSAAAVVAFVVLGKVLSPQFLIWLFPFVPLVAGRRGAIASGLVGLAAVLTQLWFPTRYWDLVGLATGPSWLVLVRGVVLLATLAVLVLPARAWAPVRRREPAPAPA